jgi:hypothetical protein
MTKTTPKIPPHRLSATFLRQANAKAAFEALPEAERDAVWQRVDRVLAAAPWIRAKSARYQDEASAHSYTRRQEWNDDDDFQFIVTFIRSGICDREKYNGRWYDVLVRHGRKYWPMGWPLNWPDGRWCTTILNKKPTEPGDR